MTHKTGPGCAIHPGPAPTVPNTKESPMECPECGIPGHDADVHDLHNITGREEDAR